jgi:branched-chain amino acid transport system ATP-binding protein
MIRREMLLKVNKIEVKYLGVVLAVKDLTMQVEVGRVVVLLGSNGSGKSTTLKAISGVLATEDGKLTQGTIEFDGHRIDRNDPETIARLGICHVMQGHPVFSQLTVDENLQMGAYLRRDKDGIRKDMERVFSYFPRLQPLRRRQSGYLSGGEQQMLVIGRALMMRPRLMLLDEPSLGLAPAIIADLFPILKRINEEEGTSLLVAEQNSAAALSIADYGYILQNGTVVAEGTTEQLKTSERLKESYLGTNGRGTTRGYYRSLAENEPAPPGSTPSNRLP